MASIRIRYVSRDVDRHGNVRFYYRRPGERKIRLRGQPGSKSFMDSYQSALAGDAIVSAAPSKRPIPGTFRATCALFFGSAGFKRLDPSTQRWHRRYLDAVCVKHAGHPIRAMEPRQVVKLRDERSDTPEAANALLKALRSLFNFAVEADLCRFDPTSNVRKLRVVSSGHHTWTADEIAVFEGRHPVGSKARLAMALLLYTTCRREDVVRLGPQHIRDGRIRFVQAKNEHRRPVEVDIPVHDHLSAIIAATPSGHLTFLATEHGRARSPNGFGNWFRDRCDEAGLHHCSAHGLRKAAASRLAELGATTYEIAAITGHRSLAEIERYTRAAQRRGLADSAMRRFKM